MSRKEIEKKRKEIIAKFKSGAIKSQEANKMLKELYNRGKKSYEK